MCLGVANPSRLIPHTIPNEQTKPCLNLWAAEEIVIKLSRKSQWFHQVKVIYAALHTKTQPSACTAALSSSSISSASSERVQRDLRVPDTHQHQLSPPWVLAWTKPPQCPHGCPSWKLGHTGRHQAGAKQGAAEEMQFGARWAGMGRCHLPNPFCCSKETHGENKRMSKLRVQLWRRGLGGGKMCESLRVSKYGN